MGCEQSQQSVGHPALDKDTLGAQMFVKRNRIHPQDALHTCLFCEKDRINQQMKPGQEQSLRPETPTHTAQDEGVSDESSVELSDMDEQTEPEDQLDKMAASIPERPSRGHWPFDEDPSSAADELSSDEAPSPSSPEAEDDRVSPSTQGTGDQEPSKGEQCQQNEDHTEPGGQTHTDAFGCPALPQMDTSAPGVTSEEAGSPRTERFGGEPQVWLDGPTVKEEEEEDGGQSRPSVEEEERQGGPEKHNLMKKEDEAEEEEVKGASPSSEHDRDEGPGDEEHTSCTRPGQDEGEDDDEQDERSPIEEEPTAEPEAQKDEVTALSPEPEGPAVGQASLTEELCPGPSASEDAHPWDLLEGHSSPKEDQSAALDTHAEDRGERPASDTEMADDPLTGVQGDLQASSEPMGHTDHSESPSDEDKDDDDEGDLLLDEQPPAPGSSQQREPSRTSYARGDSTEIRSSASAGHLDDDDSEDEEDEEEEDGSLEHIELLRRKSDRGDRAAGDDWKHKRVLDMQRKLRLERESNLADLKSLVQSCILMKKRLSRKRVFMEVERET
ncbi:sarcoplasmic reticulum histidine-rich calcium-binding protein-like [Erpetoichthys calabaricus]|uniref:sarcoplasmic reticulum histidine-rich calcium-binding protein-like n=1 Tax=Erpetoichthys calabaricus TaxID=27687 RepID=UPI0022349987|nr:sarcoplasmic reticulum histidine-rich calcium-binding protein-like [Erpetoichthys calabaricus]